MTARSIFGGAVFGAAVGVGAGLFLGAAATELHGSAASAGNSPQIEMATGNAEGLEDAIIQIVAVAGSLATGAAVGVGLTVNVQMARQVAKEAKQYSETPK